MENVKIHFADIDKSIELAHTFSQETVLYLTFFCTNVKLKTARQIGLTEKINLYHREQLKNIIIQFKRQVKAVSLKVGCCFFVA